MTFSHARGDSGDDRDDTRNGSPVLTVQEVAKLLRVGRNTVYNLAARGEIPHRRLGKRLLFHEGAILLWLAGDYASHLQAQGSSSRSSSPVAEEVEFVSAHAVAGWLRVSASTVYVAATYHGAKSIPHRRVGRKILFNRRELEDWLAARGGMRPAKQGRRRFPID